MCVRSTYNQSKMSKNAIPAIVVTDEDERPAKKKKGWNRAPVKFEDITTIEEYRFDVALRRIIGRQNSHAGFQNGSLRKESRFEWTIMGTYNCEYILVKLDPLYSFFTVTSLLPFESEVVFWFTGMIIDFDIERALSQLCNAKN